MECCFIKILGIAASAQHCCAMVTLAAYTALHSKMALGRFASGKLLLSPLWSSYCRRDSISAFVFLTDRYTALARPIAVNSAG